MEKESSRDITVDIYFEALPEYEPVKGHFSDEACEQWVLDQLESGNDAAWFCAKVTAELEGFQYSTYLGCCSYENFTQFTSEDEPGYFTDMCDEAVDGLRAKLADLRESCSRLGAV